MNNRQIGKSDLYVSEIGLGCMSLGTNKDEAIKTIDAALYGGINFLDTADLYDQGLNEEMVGSIIKSKRKDLIIATKGGNHFEQGIKGWTWNPSKKHLKSAVKKSLIRLQTDYIDLYQLHGGTIDDPIDETIEAFEDLKKEGVIRQYGLSSIRPNVIAEYVKRSGIVSVMMQYSLLDRRPEELFPVLEQYQVSVIARGPLAKGLLTERPINQISHSIQENGYLNYSFQELTEFRSKIERELGHGTIQAAALHYCLSSPLTASAVTGASNPEQIKESITTFDERTFTLEERTQLALMTRLNQYKQHRIS